MESVTIAFNDDVPADVIRTLVDELVSQGGKIKEGKNWFEQEDPILNGFAAEIPTTSRDLELFKSLQADKQIFSIESDGVITINDEERAPLVPG